MSFRSTQLADPAPMGVSDSPIAFIEQIVGPEKGRQVELAGSKISIGRSDDNDIVVQSDSVSRVHAHLMQSEGAWYIRDNGSKNGIQVNGTQVSEAWLQNGDVVQVGNFVFRFRDPNGGQQGSAAPQEEIQVEMPMAGGLEVGSYDAAGSTAAPAKKPNRRLLIYTVVGGLLALLYFNQGGDSSSDSSTTAAKVDPNANPDATSVRLQKQIESAETRKKTLLSIQDLKAKIAEVDRQIEATNRQEKIDPAEFDKLVESKRELQEKLKKTALELNSPDDPDAAIEPARIGDVEPKPKPPVGIEDPTLKQAEVEMQKQDWTNSSLREAEQFFRRGQRDYLSSNYQRAIDEFQTALSFYRGHKLAEKYLRLAIFEVEAQAKRHMAMALQYFESLQYQRAVYHFGEVVSLMSHKPQDPVVGEAERYITLSKRRLQAAELFP